MPLLKHAKKKFKQDKKRTADNLRIKETYKKMIKLAKLNPTDETLAGAFKAIDKAAKKFVIHKNKAARLKSSLAKAVAIDVTPTEAPVKKKATSKKTTKKAVK